MLFLLDLCLLTFLVPRSTKISVRLVILLAIRSILTTLYGAATIALYQALMANGGKEEATTLSAAVNGLFGLHGPNCQDNRQKRDTWDDLMSALEENEHLMNVEKLDMETLNLTKQNDLDSAKLAFETMNLTEQIDLDSATMALEYLDLKNFSDQHNYLEKEVDQYPAMLNLNWTESTTTAWNEEDIVTSTMVLSACLSIVLLFIVFFNLTLACLLARGYRTNQRKETQLREGFQALEEIYKLGQLGWEVNLN